MRRQQQVTFGLEVQTEAVNLHNFGFFACKQGAGQRVLAFFGGNFYVNGGAEVAGAVRFYVAHLQVAFFGNARRIYKVNAVLQNRV